MDILSQLLGLFQEMAVVVLIVLFKYFLYALQLVALAASIGILIWILSQTAGKKGTSLKDAKDEVTGMFVGSLPRFFYGFLVPWMATLHLLHTGNSTLGIAINAVVMANTLLIMGIPVSVGTAQKDWRWMDTLSRIGFATGSGILWAFFGNALFT